MHVTHTHAHTKSMFPLCDVTGVFLNTTQLCCELLSEDNEQRAPTLTCLDCDTRCAWSLHVALSDGWLAK